jgi:hypothetical protein
MMVDACATPPFNTCLQALTRKTAVLLITFGAEPRAAATQ